MKKLFLLIVVTLCVCMSFVFFASASYPERNITNVLVWSAGGGTDPCNRVVMAENPPPIMRILIIRRVLGSSHTY